MKSHERDQSNNNLLDFEIRKVQKLRLKNPKVQQALFGLIAWFEDTQIRDRGASLSSRIHYSESDSTAKSTVKIWPSLAHFGRFGINIPFFLKVRNKEGEWASDMHALPEFIVTGNKKKARLSVQDSNMFITALCCFGLVNISEKNLGKNKRIVEPMLDLGLKNIETYRNLSAYNFWPEQEAEKGTINRRGPLNIWIDLAEKALTVLLNRYSKSLFQLSNRRLTLPSWAWLEQCLRDERNQQGCDAIFHIPNDADDTATAVALNFLTKGQLTQDMKKTLETLSQFRDLNREHIVPESFEKWKAHNSGAFLTWLKSETENPFEFPEQGLIPGGKNNVDIVVNANVVFVLSLTGKTESPGYQDAIQLLCRAVENKTWPGAGLYHPQHMVFPYALSRAIRDGKARDKRLLKSQEKLMADLLALAKTRKQVTFFEGGKDKSRHLSTAMAICSLLNMGEAVAKKIGKMDHYHSIIESSIDFLLKEVRYKSALNASTKEKFEIKGSLRFIPHWEDGLFFGPMHWDLCHWRSQAVTHAVIMEALAKYVMAYDKTLCSDYQPYQLQVSSYDFDKLQSGNCFKVN